MLAAGAVENVTLTLERTPLGPDEALFLVTIDPPDARLELDAQEYTTGSPYELRIPARRYRVRAVHPAMRLWERDVTLAGGVTTPLEIDMERSRDRPPSSSGGSGGEPGPSGPGAITINATPWCNVSIDGRSVGETPIVNHALPSGRHTVTCTNPELGRTRTVTVNVSPGETARTRISLE